MHFFLSLTTTQIHQLSLILHLEASKSRYASHQQCGNPGYKSIIVSTLHSVLNSPHKSLHKPLIRHQHLLILLPRQVALVARRRCTTQKIHKRTTGKKHTC